MANIYHWLTGSLTDVYNGVQLSQYDSTDIGTADSRYGSDSAFEIGTGIFSAATLYTPYNASHGDNDALPNLGTGDITIAFWWQPNSGSYEGSGTRQLFYVSPNGVVDIYNRADYLDYDQQDSYGITARFRSAAWPNNMVSKDFQIDLTGNPWIKVYASRINGVFNYTLFDATGSILTDIDGNQASWSNNSHTGTIFDASSSSPHVRFGGDMAAGQTACGTYDDIFLAYDHGIAAADLETDSDGYAKIDPVINSFSTSATSATNGSSVTLSWDTDFGTTLQLLKYVGGLLTNTETVTGQVSKSVTISETVSYKLRATNVYGSVDSESVQINLSQGGNIMAIQPVGAASGSLVIQKHHLVVSGSQSFGHVMMSLNPVDTLEAGGISEYSDLNTTLTDMYSAHVAISGALSTEESVRASEDVVLSSAISIEASVRTSADSSLAAVDTAISDALDTEESVRASADASLATVDAALQSELDTTQTGVGLNADGSYNAPIGTNYLGSTTGVMDALGALDTAVGNLATDFVWSDVGTEEGYAEIGGRVRLRFEVDSDNNMYMMIENM